MSQSKQYKDLKVEWYKKLKESGFDDVEQDEDNLKEWTSSKLYRGQNNGASFEHIQVTRSSREEYYRLAGYFLYDHEFKTPLEKEIWTYHSDGKSLREIASILREQKVKIYKDKVHIIIKALTRQMLIRYRGVESNESK